MTANVCNICGLPVSQKGPPRMRLARPGGGFDHAFCTLGMDTYAFKALDRSGPPRTPPRKSRSAGPGWVRVDNIQGGWLVRCRLCGKQIRRFFMAADTNYSEAYRLAVAFEAGHRYSEMHKAALEAFHSDALPEVSREELLLAEIFGGGVPNDYELRRAAASRAAKEAARGGAEMT